MSLWIRVLLVSCSAVIVVYLCVQTLHTAVLHGSVRRHRKKGRRDVLDTGGSKNKTHIKPDTLALMATHVLHIHKMGTYLEYSHQTHVLLALGLTDKHSTAYL